MAGLLTWLMSKGDVAKRNIRATMRDPIGMLDLMAQRVSDDIGGTRYEKQQDYLRMRGLPHDAAAADEARRKQTEAAFSLALTFAGPMAKTANKGLLAKAQDMTNEGAKPFDVWQQTGWTDQFPDRKWRFEIDDSAPVSMRLHGPQFGTQEYTPLGETLSHEAAFDAYPSLRKANVTWRPEDSASYQASGPMEYINLPGKGNTKSQALHELQHAIQQREGFARGGSPQAFAKEIDPFDNYWRLAGEAEGRLVQKRMNYTPEMRRSVAPWQQFDVPIDQQIVRFVDGPAALLDLLGLR